MNRTLLPLIPLLLALGQAGALAQEHEHHAPGADSQLGSVHLPTTCRAEVAADLDRATALLHSFGYELARQAFAGVAARDPECAMAQWGIAMSLYHPVWAPPSAPELDQGRAAADKALATGGPSERERAYIRLGLWEESIQSNLASEATADALVAKLRRQWRDATRIEPPKAQLPWDRFAYALATIHFARSLGGARSGDLAVAQDGLTQLAAIHEALTKAPPAGPYDWAGEVESLRLAAAGWLAQAQGKPDAALALLRSAADLQDEVGKHPVTPGEVLPARELLADLLLELRRPSAALKEYETALAAAPSRLNGLYNAARAAELAGDTGKARAYYAQVAAQCSHADPARPEVVQARSAALR